MQSRSTLDRGVKKDVLTMQWSPLLPGLALFTCHVEGSSDRTLSHHPRYEQQVFYAKEGRLTEADKLRLQKDILRDFVMRREDGRLDIFPLQVARLVAD